MPSAKQPGSRQLEIAGVPVLWQRKRVKNLNLSVHGQTGVVRVSAPLHVREEEIRAFVNARLNWIHRHQRRFASLPAPDSWQYENGEQHPFLGRDYVLSVVEDTTQQHIRLNGDGRLHMTLRPGMLISQKASLMEAWYREQLAALIPGLIRQYEPVMAVSPAEWRIRKMKTRWGSCNIQKRRIWLNLELAKLPAHCLEYVVVHEMTHLLERGHNPRFYALMDAFLPGWRSSRDFLRQQILL